MIFIRLHFTFIFYYNFLTTSNTLFSFKINEKQERHKKYNNLQKYCERANGKKLILFVLLYLLKQLLGSFKS
jgi:hypothetical protein